MPLGCKCLAKNSAVAPVPPGSTTASRWDWPPSLRSFATRDWPSAVAAATAAIARGGDGDGDVVGKGGEDVIDVILSGSEKGGNDGCESFACSLATSSGPVSALS